MTEVPVPTPGLNDVLIKIQKTSICGTDVHINKWDAWAQRTIKPPLIIGHEYVGTVADVGAGVTGFTLGQLVTGEGHIVCGHCRNCLAGRRHLCPNTVGSALIATAPSLIMFPFQRAMFGGCPRACPSM